MEEAYRAPDNSSSAIAQAIARGALMGARGNSGVILSQIMRGLAQDISGKESLTGADFSSALKEASITAYKGLSNPVEGTILTVIKDVATATQQLVSEGDHDLTEVVETAVKAANESVANTPALLPVLKESGVVDAGGQGLFTLLEGALHYLRGEAEQIRFRKPKMITSSVPLGGRHPEMIAADEIPYGYCTEFMLKGEKLNTDKIKSRLEKKGESLIVVGDAATVRIHIHTLDPGNIIHYAGGMGTLHQVSIRNMDEQHQDFLDMQKGKSPAVDMAIVAVVCGDGLTEIFASLGVTAVIPGGQTMNPSTKDILEAVEAVASDKVIILPNNKNIVLTAQQVESLTEKSVEIVATETIPQGVAALLALDYEADLETNSRIMRQAISEVKTVEITRAVRSTQINDIKVKRKQAIGLLEGDLVSVGNDPAEVLRDALTKLDMDDKEIVTVYFGANTDQAGAERAISIIREDYPQLQVEVVQGGQPHYNYIVSVE